MPGDAPPTRTCTECPNPVTGRKITCSDRCRSRRSKRQRETLASGRDVPTLVTDEAERLAQEELRKQIVPVVREALTEEVLRGIENLVGSVPKAVEVATGLLDHDDEEIRYKAAALILRHTTGNKQVVPDVNDSVDPNMTVIFNVPQQERTGVIELGGAAANGAVETKECDSCFEHKPLTDFESGSDRCTQCFNGMRAKAIATLGRGAVEHE